MVKAAAGVSVGCAVGLGVVFEAGALPHAASAIKHVNRTSEETWLRITTSQIKHHHAPEKSRRPRGDQQGSTTRVTPIIHLPCKGDKMRSARGRTMRGPSGAPSGRRSRYYGFVQRTQVLLIASSMFHNCVIQSLCPMRQSSQSLECLPG